MPKFKLGILIINNEHAMSLPALVPALLNALSQIDWPCRYRYFCYYYCFAAKELKPVKCIELLRFVSLQKKNE